MSQSLDHVMRPLARDLGVKWVVANRLEFRDGIATGRLLDPVIRPRGLFARITGAGPDGARTPERLVRELALQNEEELKSAVLPAEREQWSTAGADRVLRRETRDASAVGKEGAGGETHHADWGDWLHRQSVAGEFAYRSAGDWARFIY